MAAPVKGADAPSNARVAVTLLGQFSVNLGPHTVSYWRRPSARRLCQLVMVSPGCRISRHSARSKLFANLSKAAAANALSKALSMAREALLPLGPGASGLLRADRTYIWIPKETNIDIDLVVHEAGLRSALAMTPGLQRDAALWEAVSEEATLLEDEPFADWALEPRDALEILRQRARTELARDRSAGRGRAGPTAVIEAWESVSAHDLASEEAASALARIYIAQGRRQQALTALERCGKALEELGLRASPALKEAERASAALASRSAETALAAGVPGPLADRIPGPVTGEERRIVSVLFAELTGVGASPERRDPEELRRLVGGALARAIAEVEGLRGTVTAVSGAGLVAVFGAPEAHEDDPERAVRAAYRVLGAWNPSGDDSSAGQLRARIGVETGPVVVGASGPR